MLELRSATARGAANFGWLDSKHSFSFGRYYDPAHMGFSALRVINDDWVAPGAGFDTHGHRDMEIISMVLAGKIAHKDSTGQQQVLPVGEFQLMSAGRGIMHSEFNASASDELKFLQIWIEPNVRGTDPGYQQQAFAPISGMQLIASPDGREQSLKLRQDASLYQLRLAADAKELQQLDANRKYYLHLISGELQLATAEGLVTLRSGDGVKIAGTDALQLQSIADSHGLWFDLP
ncbi:MAG: pirin family protein [Rheinheimera sp.]|nr:pirin family protein [Rheinheimera sp.]